MINCAVFFGSKDKNQSILRDRLIKQYGEIEGDILYSELANGKATGPMNFRKFLDDKGDFMRYENNEPTIEMFEEWFKQVSNYNQINKVFSTNNYTSTTQDFLDLVEGYNYYLGKVFEEEGVSPSIFDKENKGLGRMNNQFNNAYEMLLDRIEQRIEQNKNPEKLVPLRNALKNNKKLFNTAYLNYIESTTGLKLEGIDLTEEEIDQLETEESKDSAFNKNSNETDVKKSAGKAVKFAMSIIPDKNADGSINVNNLGMRKVVPYNRIFNKIQQELEPVEPDIIEYINALRNMKSIFPGIDTLINLLNSSKTGTYSFTGSKVKDALSQQFRTQFVNQFNKANTEYKLFVLDPSTNQLKIVSANADTADRLMFAEFETVFRERLANNKISFNRFQTAKKLDADTRLELLGITPPKNYDVADVDAIYEYGAKSQEQFDELFRPKRGEGVKQRFLNIARRVVEESQEVLDFQIYNTENKLIYAISLNNYLSTVVKDLNNLSGNKNAIKAKYPELFEGFAYGSEVMKSLSNPSAPLNITIGNYDGIRSADRAATNKKLWKRDLMLERMIGLLTANKYPLMRAADRGIENYFDFGRLFVTGRDSAKAYLLNHLEAERRAMKTSVNVAHYNDNNQDFRVFHINTKNGKKSLLEVFNPELTKAKERGESEEVIKAEMQHARDIFFEENLDSERVEKFIDTLIDQTIEEEKEAFEEVMLYSSLESLPQLSEVRNKGFKEADRMVEMFALNMFIGNIEQTKVFIGDPAFFKNPADVFKRIAMFNSTKESARTDEEMNKYIEGLTKEFEKKNRRKNSEIHTVTLQDVYSDIKSFDEAMDEMFKSIFSEKEYQKYSKIYNDMNEADAQAFMTYDEYRIANIRFGTWTHLDEVLYNKIAQGDTSVAEKILRRATVKKYQYTGTLSNYSNPETGVAIKVPAGRKFSVIPLIPGAIDPESTLGKLSEKMNQEGIGMAFFESAAKFGHKVDKNGKANMLYDGANFVFEPNMIDILDYKYMGDQVKIHNEPKNSITASSQKRKIQLADFFRGGKLAVEEFKTKLVNQGMSEEEADKLLEEEVPRLQALIENYDEMQAKLVSMEFTAIMGFPIEKAIALSDNMSTFTDILIRQGKKLGYSTNELQALNILKETQLIDILPNKQKLESLITALLRNNVVNNKRTGTSLAQVSDVGFEVAITGEVEAVSKRHNLKFYRLSKDKTRMLPMEVMVPLPENLVGYVKYQYGNGSLTQEALEKFNRDIEKANKAFEAGDESNKFYNMLNKLTTYVGFRIPNQAASSSDVAKVKKFMFPTLGGTIVVPKPIVAKTGSDFDIDKLNLYIPNVHLKRTGYMKKGLEVIKESEMTRDQMYWYFNQYGVIFELEASNKELNELFVEHVLNEPIRQSDDKLLKTLKVAYAVKQETMDNYDMSYVEPGVDSKAQVENNLLETEIDLTLHRLNWDNLLRPLGTAILKGPDGKSGVVKTIRDLTKQNSDADHISDIFKNWKNADKFNAFLSGQAGVGQVAVHITNHVLAQKAGLKMKREYDFFSKSAEVRESEWRDLDLVYNEDGNLISEVLSELLTAYVDIAKDPYILDINAVNSTANTILMMTRWGMSTETIFLFMNQPIIKEFVKREAINNSISNHQRKSNDQVVLYAMRALGINNNTSDLIYTQELKKEEANDLTRKVSSVHSQTPITNKELKAALETKYPDKRLQLKVLDAFLLYKRQSQKLQEMIRSMSPDTQNFKSASNIEMQAKLKDKVSESGYFMNYDKVFKTGDNDTFIGRYQSAKTAFFNHIKDMFIAQQEEYKEQIDELKEFATQYMYNQEERDKMINMIEGDFIVYILARKGFLATEADFAELMEGDKSIPKIIKKMKEDGYKNPFLDAMLPLPNDTREGFDSMKMRIRRTTEYEKEAIKEGISELKDNEAWIEENYGVKDFFTKLVKYQLLQSGLTNSPYSFHNFIPVQEFSELVKGHIIAARDSSTGIAPELFTNTSFARKRGRSLFGEELTQEQLEYIAETSPLHWSQFIYNHLKYFSRAISEETEDQVKVRMNNNTGKLEIKDGLFTYKQLGNPPRYIKYGVTPEVETANRNKALNEAVKARMAEQDRRNNAMYDISPQREGEINPQLEKVLEATLKGLGVDVNYINNIQRPDGSGIGAAGRARLFEAVVEVSRKRRGVTTLPEEASHMITGLMGKDHAIIKQMMNTVQKLPIYEKVKEEYYGLPGYATEQDVQFEAVGKVLAEFIILENEGIGKTDVVEWWARLLRVLGIKLKGVNLQELRKELQVFEDLAKEIVNSKLRNEELLRSEVGRRKRLLNIIKSYNMKENGFFSSKIDPEALRTDLSKANLLEDFNVRESRTGGYYLTRNNKKFNPFTQIFYQLEGSTPEEIQRQFEEDDSKLGEMFVTRDEYGLPKERYVYDKQVVKDRITGLQDDMFRRYRTAEEIIAIATSIKSEYSRKVGTEGHNLSEDFMLDAITARDNLRMAPGKTPPTAVPKPENFSEGQMGAIVKSVRELADHIQKTQEDIDKNGSATVYTERFVIDQDRELAGTSDVVVIYSDGSASIYDYKFINFFKTEINGRWTVDPKSHIAYIKEKAYSMQIGEYKRILKEKYGIRKFRDTRVMPFNVQYKTNEKGEPTGVSMLEGFSKDSAKNYLVPLPVSREMTDNPKFNEILTRLFEKEESLAIRIRENWNNDEMVEKLQLEASILKDAIKGIQVKGDVTPLINTLNTVLKHTYDVAQNVKMDEIDEVVRMTNEINLFEQIYTSLASDKSLLSEDNKKEVYNLTANITRAKAMLKDKLQELMIDFVGEEVTNPQRELSLYKRNMAYMSKIDQPIFEKAWELIKTANTRILNNTRSFSENLKKYRDNLAEWAKGRGISLMDAYAKITNEKTGNLIPMLSATFFEQRQKAFDTKNVKWLRENYKISERGEKLFEKDLRQYKKHLKRTVGLESNLGKYKLETWMARNNLKNNQSAWLNKRALFRYAELQNEENHYSAEYRAIRNIKPLHDYYTFYREANAMFNELVEERIGGTFVANVQKDMIDTIAQNKNLFRAMGAAKQDFLQGLMVRQNDDFNAIGDDVIPLMYYDNFMYKNADGKWVKDLSKKNMDLSNNLQLFAEAVYRKHHMSEIKDTIDAMKLYISDQKVIKMRRNKPAIKEGTTNELDVRESDVNANVFDKMTKSLVYGQKIQNDDTTFKVGDREISGNKLLASIMKFLSVKALSFNYVSGFGNLAAGYANTYIKGVGGRFYNQKQMWKAHKLLMSRGNGDLFNHVREYFSVEKEYWVKELAGDLSASKLTKNLRFDKFFLLQQKGDEFIADTVLVAMMQNYGLEIKEENGKKVVNVKKLSELPQGSKSLLDRTSIINDKIVVDGMNESAFTNFRNKVRYVSRQIKGTTTREDVFTAQTNVIGRMFLHFRSWIAPMIDERFGSLKYTKEIEEWELGRYKSFVKEFTNKRFIPQIGKVLLDVASLGAFQAKGDVEIMRKQYEDFLKDNPDISPDKMTFDAYLDMRHRALRESIAEIRILLGILLLNILAWSDWDDTPEDKEYREWAARMEKITGKNYPVPKDKQREMNYKKTKLTREVYKLFRRGYLELTFFLSPASTQELLRKPIPALQVLTDIFSIGANTIDETTDWIFQENNNSDKTGWGHYTGRTIPLANQVLRFMDDMTDAEDDGVNLSPLRKSLK